MYRLEFLDGTSGTAQSDINKIENYLALFDIHSDVRSWKPFQQFLVSLKQHYPVKSQTKRAFRESELEITFRYSNAQFQIF